MAITIPQQIESDLISVYVGVYLVQDGTTVTASTLSDNDIRCARLMATSKMKRYVAISKYVEIPFQRTVDLPEDFDGVLDIVTEDQGSVLDIYDSDDDSSPSDESILDNVIRNYQDYNSATKDYYDSIVDYTVDMINRKLLIRNVDKIVTSRAIMVYDILDKYVKPEYYDSVARDFFREFFFAYLDQITGSPLKKYKVADGEERVMNAKEAIEKLGDFARATFIQI